MKLQLLLFTVVTLGSVILPRNTIDEQTPGKIEDSSATPINDYDINETYDEIELAAQYASGPDQIATSLSGAAVGTFIVGPLWNYEQRMICLHRCGNHKRELRATGKSSEASAMSCRKTCKTK